MIIFKQQKLKEISKECWTKYSFMWSKHRGENNFKRSELKFLGKVQNQNFKNSN